MEQPLNIDSVTIYDRTQLAADLRKYWLGRDNSHVGMQFLTLKDGIVHARNIHGRRDVLHVTLTEHLFVQTDGRSSCDDGKEEAIAWAMEQHADVVAANDAFFKAEPWKHCDGKTVEEAIAILEPWQF